MIYVCGDTHGVSELYKITNKAFVSSENFTRDDVVIVLGDFGLFWDNTPNEIAARNRISDLPFTVLFIDGNHENFDMLFKLPVAKKYGGTVGVGGENLFWLKRGEIYDINGLNIFTFGGALSVDKYMRKAGISWWAKEIPGQDEYEYALKNLENFHANGGKIDIVLSHTAPNFAIKHISDLLYGGKKIEDITSRYLENIFAKTSPKRWYFGHFHGDREFSAFECDFYLCYDKILRVI